MTLCDQNSSNKSRQRNSVGCKTVYTNHYNIQYDKLALDGDNSHTRNTTAMTHKPHLQRAMHMNQRPANFVCATIIGTPLRLNF